MTHGWTEHGGFTLMMRRWSVWVSAGGAGLGVAGTLTLKLDRVEVTRDVLGVISVEAAQPEGARTPISMMKNTTMPRTIMDTRRMKFRMGEVYPNIASKIG
jgi:hypothetical protein